MVYIYGVYIYRSRKGLAEYQTHAHGLDELDLELATHACMIMLAYTYISCAWET